MADLNAFVYRPQALLQREGYTAPIRRLSLGSIVNSLKYGSTQAELEAAIEARLEQVPQQGRYPELLFNEIQSERRHLMQDGWGYFKDEDYLRARSCFEAAELVDNRAPAPRFGQLVVDVQRKHFRRAVTALARIMTYDAERPAGVPGMFEYNVSLQAAYGSADDLVTMLAQLRQFAQRNFDTKPVQALYCYVLWYSRYSDAMIEAAGIASRLQREAADPDSPWARLHGQLQEARRKLEQARTGRPPGETSPPADDSAPM